MAIQFFTGTGGVHAMFRKLAEVWNFASITSDNGEMFSDTSASGGFKLWVTDEVYLHYSASEGWADAANASQYQPCLKHGSCATWKIVRTECGVAFGDGEDVSIFIGRTIASDGTQSFGIIARSTSGTSTYVRITDGMTAAQDAADIQYSSSVHYTQLSNVVLASVPVYFPDIYQVCTSPQTTNRVAQIGADVFYCTQRIAIRDTAAATGSVDLSGYYNAAQTDAKIKAVETVLSEEIAGVSEAVRASERARTQSIKVYVSPSGSDSNDGMTSGTAFATLGRALEATEGYGSEHIQLAAGTYDVPDKLLSLYKRMIVIAGAGQDDTTIRGCLALYGTILVLGSLTLDGTDADYADQSVSAPLRAMRASDVRAASSTIRSAGIYCAAVAESSVLDMQSCTFVGASTNCVFVTTFGDATLLSCTDTTGMPLICGGGCTAAIAKSTGISWTAANNGIVWVDGVQKSPVEVTTEAVQVSTE